MASGRDAKTGKPDIEHLSSLIDGELDAEQAAAVIEALCTDPGLKRRWSDLQLVGDALRSHETAACHVDGFCDRVRGALAGEPTVLAPARARSPLRRFIVPTAAIAASVAAIGFIAVPLLKSPAPQVAVQRVEATTQVAAPAVSTPPQKVPAAIANARALDPYFAAHRELTGGTALPRAAAYLRPNGGER
jgi:sigma-E factor negative regulatory protein RseA